MNRLKSIRILNNMTQEDLADNIGTTVRTIQKYEAAENLENMKAYMLRDISALFKVRMEDLLE